MPRSGRHFLWLPFCLLAACAPGLSLKQAEPLYNGTAGSYEVLELPNLLLPGGEGQAPLQVRAHLPVGAEPFPVIVFSHGAWGTNDEYLVLMRFWSSHGYVTLQPNHSDSSALGIKVGDRDATRGAEKRPNEIRRLLAGLSDVETWAPDLAGKIDLDRVGVAGHSAGAATALQVAGALAFFAGREHSYADSRVKAVVALAAPAVGSTLREASMAALHLPLLVVAGSLDVPNRGDKDPSRRRAAFDFSPGPSKYLLWVEGMDHGLGGIQGPKSTARHADNPRHRHLVELATLAFWDAALKDSERAQRYLLSGALARLSNGAATIERK